MSKSILQRKRILTKASGGSSISTPVSVANGGTGISSYAIGDIIYASGATTLSKLPIGTASQQLRVNAGATALEYFTPTSGGITIGGTAITGGTDRRILFQDATASDFVTQIANFTMGSVATGVLDVPIGYAIAGVNFAKIYAYGGPAYSLTIGNNTSTNSHQVIIDPYGGISSAASFITVVGSRNGTPTYGSISVGGYAGQGTTMGLHANAIGFFTSATFGSSIALGSLAATTKANQLVIGGDASPYSGGSSVGISEVVIGNGVTHTSPTGVVIRVSGGSGSNINGGNLSFYAGLPTGDGSNVAAGRNGYISWWTGDVGASGTTLRTATEKARLVQGGDFVLGITSDTKGLVLKSPDGNYWRVTISDLGVLTTTSIGTSIPN